MEPVALAPVDRALMRAPAPPRCALPERGDYSPSEVLAYAHCWRAAYHSAAARVIGLQKAVDARERATSRAVAAKS